MAEPPISKFVIVDDGDPLLEYEGEWETNPEGIAVINRPKRTGPLYRDTARWTTTNGSVSVSFNGSWARLQGATNLTSSRCPTCPSWTCTVDGRSVPLVPPSLGLVSNRILCDWGPLPDGPHTVTLNVTGRGDRFWVDFFWYIPSPGLSIEPPPTLFVHPFVPEVNYDHSWVQIPNGLFNRVTNATGAQLNFTFIGTSVAWYGIIPKKAPSAYSTAEYSIDGAPATPFFVNGLAGTSEMHTNQRYFQSPPLPYGRHELSVVHRGNPQTALVMDTGF
ncbi:hypothetical protein CC2G_013736 [Coprinopsis cinerea AmutBmut pab1-1]|nr:hypothetical protein CC2G_013736 [Coprinopsis cinerea AmutBmut pab1-1]